MTTLMQWLSVGWAALAKGGRLLWASIAALLASPAVWLACGAVFVAGFATGHWERNHAVEKIKADYAELITENAAIAHRLKAARQEADEAKRAITSTKTEDGTPVTRVVRAKRRDTKELPK